MIFLEISGRLHLATPLLHDGWNKRGVLHRVVLGMLLVLPALLFGQEPVVDPAARVQALSTEVPPPFFLVPTVSAPARVGLSTPREMVFLFTAPLLNRDRIAAVAGRLETHSRGILENRQRQVAGRLCTGPDRAARLAAYRSELERQRALWGRVQERFQAMQRDRIQELLPVFRHTEALKLNRTVAELQRERQDLVVKAWREFFDDLAGDLEDCDRPADYVQLPSEKLHPPVFLARYYFFRMLPARLRIKFAS